MLSRYKTMKVHCLYYKYEKAYEDHLCRISQQSVNLCGIEVICVKK